MTRTATDHETQAIDCAGKLRALADGTRLAVVEALIEGPKHVHELMALLEVEQSLLSHHLRVLREIGLLAATRDGKAVLYHLAPGVSCDGTGKAIDLGCCQLSFARATIGSRRSREDER